jgi:hypothetical protein
MIDEQEYLALIERVRAIDPEAAEYLEGPCRDLDDFEPGWDLMAVMVWSDTPQGHEYWCNICDLLEAAENE